MNAGGERAVVAAGEAVTFTARIGVPPAPGRVVSAEWDFEGVGTYPDAAELGDPDLGAGPRDDPPPTPSPNRAPTSPRYVSLSTSARSDPGAPFARSLNLGRVRVVVNE